MHARLRKENENAVKITGMPCTSCMERSRCTDGKNYCDDYARYREIRRENALKHMGRA